MNSSTHGSHSASLGSADYIIVVSNEDDYHANYHNFAEKVNRKLRAGYQLHGQPFNVNHTLCQAMVRPADVPVSGDTTIFMKHPVSHHG